MKQEMNEIVYTSDMLLSECLQKINGDNVISRIVQVRGYVSNIKNNKEYSYADFKTKDSKYSINLYANKTEDNLHILKELEKYNNPFFQKEVVLKGRLRIFCSNDFMRLTLIPLSIIQVQENKDCSNEAQDKDGYYGLVYQKVQNGYKDIAMTLDRIKGMGCKPKLVLVRPLQETVEEDIRRGLGASRDMFDIKSLCCDFSQPQKIAQTLKEADMMHPDMVLMSRGGGAENSLNILDDRCILEQIVAMETPLMVGLGHAKNHFLAESLADRACVLPHDIGVTLSRLYSDKLMALETKEYHKRQIEDYKKEVERQRNEIKDLKEKAFNLLNKRKESFYGITGTGNVVVKTIVLILMLMGLITIVSLFN